MSAFLTYACVYFSVNKRQQSASRDLPQQQPTAVLAFPCTNHGRNAPPYSNPVGTETTSIRTLKRRDDEVGRWEHIRMWVWEVTGNFHSADNSFAKAAVKVKRKAGNRELFQTKNIFEENKWSIRQSGVLPPDGTLNFHFYCWLVQNCI